MRRFVAPSVVVNQRPVPNPAMNARLSKALEAVHSENRMPSNGEPRMMPTVQLKDKHHPFDPTRTELDSLGIVKGNQFSAPLNQPGKSGYIKLTHQQQEKNLSVPTAASMVVQCFGGSASAREIKVLSRNNQYDPTAEFNDFTGTYFRDVITAVSTLGFTWASNLYPSTEDGSRAGIEDIKKSIDQGNPVLLDSLFNGSHVVVATGYDETSQTLIIMDTKLPAPGLRIISYKHVPEIWNSVKVDGRACVFTSPKR